MGKNNQFSIVGGGHLSAPPRSPQKISPNSWSFISESPPPFRIGEGCTFDYFAWSQPLFGFYDGLFVEAGVVDHARFQAER